MLTIESMSKRFDVRHGSKLSVDPIRDLSFTVAPGEFLGIVGPSGIGKSTVLKCIYRTYLPTSGRIAYDSVLYGNIDLAQAKERQIVKLRRQEIRYVSQFLRVIPRVSAMDVVAEQLLGAGCGKVEALERASRILEQLGIPESLWSAFPATFSGGEQQRINLAKALVVSPRLLILDEPTASLDRDTKIKVVRLLKQLKDEGTTMIGVFHDIDIMEQLADRTLVLKSSEI